MDLRWHGICCWMIWCSTHLHLQCLNAVKMYALHQEKILHSCVEWCQQCRSLHSLSCYSWWIGSTVLILTQPELCPKGDIGFGSPRLDVASLRGHWYGSARLNGCPWFDTTVRTLLYNAIVLAEWSIGLMNVSMVASGEGYLCFWDSLVGSWWQVCGTKLLDQQVDGCQGWCQCG